MAIYALLKGQDAGFSSFHGITSEFAESLIWDAASENNHSLEFAANDDNGYSSAQVDPYTFPSDDE